MAGNGTGREGGLNAGTHERGERMMPVRQSTDARCASTRVAATANDEAAVQQVAADGDVEMPCGCPTLEHIRHRVSASPIRSQTAVRMAACSPDGRVDEGEGVGQRRGVEDADVRPLLAVDKISGEMYSVGDMTATSFAASEAESATR